ncbi:hypothetical protein HK405_008451 [Cladochytrium tenue]|nr:hypothetical protein HK405_008451 [Cladochytrium tenue]
MLFLSHEVLRRGCRQAFKHAANLNPSQASEFAGYCLAFLANLKSHHDQEEEALFPLLKAKAPGLNTRHEEHVVLAEAMGAATRYLEEVRDQPDSWDTAKFEAAMGPVRDVVLPHVTAEEGDINPDKLRAGGVTLDDMAEVMGKMAETGKKQDRTTVLAFLLVHLTPSERTAFFGKMPWVVRDYILPVYTLWNYGLWEFASTETEVPSASL